MGFQGKATHSSTGQIEMVAKQSKVQNSAKHIKFLNSILHFSETYENILNFKNITEVLDSISIVQVNHSTEIFEKDELVKLLGNIKPQPVYPDGLFTIDLRDYIRGKTIQRLEIRLHTSRINASTLLIGKVSSDDMIQFSIFYFSISTAKAMKPCLPAEDAGEVGVRPVLDTLERHTGDKMEGLRVGSVYTYNIKFSQEIYNDQKSRETCRHYPDDDFKTYEECDMSYVRSRRTSLCFWIFDIFV